MEWCRGSRNGSAGKKRGRQKPAQRRSNESVGFRALPPGFDLGADLDISIDTFTTASSFGFVTKEGCGVGTDNRARPVSGACLPLLGDREFTEVLGFREPGAVGIAVAHFDCGAHDWRPVVDRTRHNAQAFAVFGGWVMRLCLLVDNGVAEIPALAQLDDTVVEHAPAGFEVAGHVAVVH